MEIALTDEGVWGSYKFPAQPAKVSSGIHGLPQVNFVRSNQAKFTIYNHIVADNTIILKPDAVGYLSS